MVLSRDSAMCRHFFSFAADGGLWQGSRSARGGVSLGFGLVHVLLFFFYLPRRDSWCNT